jgi:peptide/nickel transport system permease protein
MAIPPELSGQAQPVLPSKRRLKLDPAGYVGLAIVTLLVAASVLAPYLAPHNPTTLFPNGLRMDGSPLGPSHLFPLGTDRYGRDELSRLLWGGRTTLGIAVTASLLATALGTVVGLLGGFFGGWADELLGRVTDVVMSFPVTLFAIAMVMIVHPSIGSLILVIALIYWTYTARLIRAEVVTLRTMEFVAAAVSVGATPVRVLFRHLLPHVVSTAIVRFTLSISQTILLEAGLSYLGAGVQPPTPDWGLMVAESQTYYATDPMLVIWPGILILLAVVSVNLLGEALRDALEPGVSRLA